jgi:tocopherol O-methyltransferase
MATTAAASEGHAVPSHDISNDYEIPAAEPFTSFEALKNRIRHHYELCSDYYYSLW